jgi:hypothetical protein
MGMAMKPDVLRHAVLVMISLTLTNVAVAAAVTLLVLR